MTFVSATTIDEALSAIQGGARPIAGGTDLVVQARHGSAPLPSSLVAVDRVAEMHGIEITSAGLRIGASVTHAELLRHRGVGSAATALQDGCALVGSPATRHVGTLGGNIMNASPAMDTGAPLVVLDASVELASNGGIRLVPVGQMWEGPGRTVAGTGELCVAVRIPEPAPRTGSAYVRLEYRRAMEIAVVGAAAMVRLSPDGGVAGVRCALAAVAPTIIEVDLAALDPADGGIDDVAAAVAELARAAAQPISDLRASARYRRHTVGVMADRAVRGAAARAAGDRLPVPLNRSSAPGATQ